MTTTVIKSIKPAGGGDYSSLNDFQTNYPNKNLTSQDIILVAECYAGNCLTGSVNFSGWTTDSTRYLWVRAATSARHAGVWDTNKAYGSASVAGNGSIIGTNMCLRVTGMQIEALTSGRAYFADTGGATNIVEQCIMRAPTIVAATWTNKNVEMYSSILIGGSTYSFANSGNAGIIQNCTIISTGIGIIEGATGQVVSSQNNYISAPTCYYPTGGGVINKGSNDATSNTEALTPALRSIPYSTANFVNVTGGSENLHLVVGSVLRDAGTTTSAVIDIDGRVRIVPFDIGADEYLDAPVCWNYTARYRNSTKLFKASGCGNYPKSLRAPSNIDKTTGRMIDDGVEIDPSEYEII
jgi:hypothetical protein